MRRFKAGELKVDAKTPILLEGSNSPQLFTVLRGMGLRYKILPNGRRQVVNFVLPGDFIGLQAGVMGEMKHSVDAATAMSLCVFNRSELWTLFQHQPERAFDLTWLAAKQNHFLGDALTAVGQMSAEQRICWGMVRFFNRCDAIGITEGTEAPFPFKQQDLADAVGLSLVHTNKTLTDLRNRQILAWRDDRIRILDKEQAEDLAMLGADEDDGPRPLL